MNSNYQDVLSKKKKKIYEKDFLDILKKYNNLHQNKDQIFIHKYSQGSLEDRLISYFENEIDRFIVEQYNDNVLSKKFNCSLFWIDKNIQTDFITFNTCCKSSDKYFDAN